MNGWDAIEPSEMPRPPRLATGGIPTKFSTDGSVAYHYLRKLRILLIRKNFRRSLIANELTHRSILFDAKPFAFASLIPVGAAWLADEATWPMANVTALFR
jgi:hypothetical protein